MIQAYHLISLSNLDAGRLGSSQGHDPDVIAVIVERVHQKYLAIRAEGQLRPALEDEHSRQFVADHLVGDDQYVFLSAGKRYWAEPEQVNFGFVFDAEQLIGQGTIVRAHDLLGDYEDLLGEVVAERSGWRDPSNWTPEETARLMAAIDDSDSTDESYSAPNDTYYRLLDAVQAMDDSVPGVSEALAAFREQAAMLQRETQYIGEAAKVYLREHSTNGSAELLVKDCLAISQAIAVIEYGVVK